MSDLDPLTKAAMLELTALNLSKQGFLSVEKRAALVEDYAKLELSPYWKERRIEWLNSLAGDVLDADTLFDY